MKKLALILLLSLPCFGQAFYSLPTPLPNTSVRVCPVPSGGNPCPSPSSIFNDSGLSQTLSNPYQVGASGNFGFWVAAGQYTIQIGQPYNEVYVISLGGGGGGVTPVAVGNAVQQLYAVNSGVVGEGHFSFNFSASNTSNIVTCNTCAFTTNAKAGQLIFATNLLTGGFSFTSSVVLAQTTILSVDSNTQIHTTGNFTAGCTVTNCMLTWGTDESAALNTLFSTAAGDQCASIFFPSLNPEGTGPAVILISSAPAAITCPGGTSTGGSRNGLALIGPGGPSGTYIMFEPNFTSSSCTLGQSAAACFALGLDGGHIYGITFHGGGVSGPGSGFNTKVAVELDSQNNSYMDNCAFLFWGGNNQASGGLAVGLLAQGQLIASNIDIDGFGGIGLKIGNGGAGGGYSGWTGLSVYDNYYENVLVNGGTTTPMVATNVNLGNTNPCASCGNISVMNTTTQSQLYMTNAEIGFSGGASAQNGIEVGTASVDGTVTNGTGAAYLNNVSLYAGNSASSLILFSNAGNVAHIEHVNFGSTSATQYMFASTGDTIFDDGGNTFASTTPATLAGTGLLRTDGRNISGACTGTAPSSSTVGLYGTGPNVTTAACATTIGNGVVMQNAGTLRVLQATAGTGGFNASSGVVTVLKNGATQTLTCTLGTGTACIDGTHTVAYVAGDLISIQFTTQATETLANVKANVSLY